jgi:glycosyltransferase involved in cell wall biosynthesis
MTKTVLHLCKSGERNAPLLNEMSKAGAGRYRTLVCYLTGTAGKLNEVDSIADATLYLGLAKKQLNWTRFATLQAVAKVIDTESVDLVICQFRRQIGIGILAAMLSRRKPKVVGILHGIVGGKIGLGRKVFNFLLYPRLARLVSVSQNGVGDILRLNWKMNEGNVMAIQNGIDFAQFIQPRKASEEDVLDERLRATRVFGSVGRLTQVKNTKAMIRAFSIACQDHPDISLVLAGTGPDETAARTLVKTLGIEDRVTFLGFRQDIPQLLRELDVYVMPSLREGLPLALLEAMGSGLPVLTSNCSGMKEVVGDTPCGELVDPGDVQDIANGFLRLAACSEGALLDMGAAARKRAVTQFSAARMTEDYANLYRELLSE